MSPEYLAGFFDGEGSIMMVDDGKGRYYPRLNIANTNREILDQIAQHFGGRVRVKNYNCSRPQWKPAYAWTSTSLTLTRHVLEVLLPHLRLKRAQAQVVLDWYVSKDSSTRDVIRILNRRGAA